MRRLSKVTCFLFHKVIHRPIELFNLLNYFLLLTAILKDLGIQEYESRVVNQLLEFTYRYVSSVLGEFPKISNGFKLLISVF